MTRPELMKELNRLLNTDFNWSRLSLLDLKRLVDSIKNKMNKICTEAQDEKKIR